MKKFFAVMLSLMLMVLTFASCQSTDKTNSSTNTAPETTESISFPPNKNLKGLQNTRKATIKAAC